uniref:Uncharacterized protein n=1 Tax=Denticeps clupeoides TaxID=299321 RepID=A0AAY4CXX4_9TELE
KKKRESDWGGKRESCRLHGAPLRLPPDKRRREGKEGTCGGEERFHLEIRTNFGPDPAARLARRGRIYLFIYFYTYYL